MNSQPETQHTEHPQGVPEHQHDVVSDPAHNDQLGQDWTDEGGAMPEGPATDQQKTSLKDEDSSQ